MIILFTKIPFESIVDFKTNSSEITKMSLEHDFFVNDGVVLGNFYISGEYKVYEVSINTESFKHTLPFTVELRDDIKKDSLEFNIEDFAYEIVEGNKLKVNIEYSLTAEVEEELFERVNEDELESELSFIDDFLEDPQIVEPVNDKEEKDNEESIKEEVVPKLEDVKEERKEEKVEEEITPISEEIPEVTPVKEENERLNPEEEKTIMETIQDSDDTFVTYHIHVVKESETKESICALYNVSASIVDEYNEFDSLSTGDKILIPKIDE